MKDYFVLTICGLAALAGGCASSDAQQNSKPITPAKPNAVAALGRIQPNGEAIKLSVPNAQDSRVDRILVKEGDFVKQNQTIAILQGIDRKQAELRDAQADVKLRQIELGKVTQGDFKQAQITGQTAAINKLQAQLTSTRKQQTAALIGAKTLLQNAQANYQRQLKSQQRGLGLLAAKAKLVNATAEYRRRLEFDRSGNSTLGSQTKLTNAEAEYQRQLTLYRSGGISKSILDKAQAELNLARAGVGERGVDTKTQLDKAKEDEVRPADIRLAQAQLEKAQIAVEQKQAALRDSEVRVPVAGQILKINTRIGEQVNTSQGIVELAQTDKMFVIAEIAEIDINKIQPGQSATITSEYQSFAGELRGTVSQIGLQVGRKQSQEAGGNNPTTDKESRVVTIKIEIAANDSPKVAKLTNMQVRVRLPLKT